MNLTGFDISENEKDDFFQKTSGDVINILQKLHPSLKIDRKKLLPLRVKLSFLIYFLYFFYIKNNLF